MTAVIDGVMVTGTAEEISHLIKIHNMVFTASGSTVWQYPDANTSLKSKLATEEEKKD